MECKHERIQSVNCVISCMDCGKVLPNYFKTAANRQKQAKNTPADAGTDKAPAKNKTAKNVK